MKFRSALLTTTGLGLLMAFAHGSASAQNAPAPLRHLVYMALPGDAGADGQTGVLVLDVCVMDRSAAALACTASDTLATLFAAFGSFGAEAVMVAVSTTAPTVVAATVSDSCALAPIASEPTVQTPVEAE